MTEGISWIATTAAQSPRNRKISVLLKKILLVDAALAHVAAMSKMAMAVPVVFRFIMVFMASLLFCCLFRPWHLFLWSGRVNSQIFKGAVYCLTYFFPVFRIDGLEGVIKDPFGP